jgi:hypothetical protein
MWKRTMRRRTKKAAMTRDGVRGRGRRKRNAGKQADDGGGDGVWREGW